MTLALTNALLDGERVGLRVDQGRIVAVGPDAVADPADEVIDAGGMWLMPGLVNGHTHAAMTLFRGFGDDLPLMEWLQTRIWPAEARLSADDVYWGTRLACIEMIRSGTTSFHDMYWHAPATARAVVDSGMRASVGAALFDGGPGAPPEKRAALRDEAEAALDGMAGLDPRVQPAFGPHGVYTVSPESLEWVAATANERDLEVHIHLSETHREVEDCINATGARPGELLDRCGLLGPRTILAHGCWLEPFELELIAARGATIVTNPVSNMKLAVGRQFPYLEAVAVGVPIGLGTDGAASNNSLDLLQDAKVFALAQKFAADDPATLPAGEVLAVARGQRSVQLGGRAIEPGAPADFLLVRADVPELTPGDHDANLVYAATGAVVDTVVVDGQVLMRGRVIDGADEVVAEARARAARVRSN